MGTRSLTVFIEDHGFEDDRNNEEICVLYRQFDGYISGHGHELARFLAEGGPVVNGITKTPCFNGASNLVAQVIGHFDASRGGFYVHPAGTRDTGEEYTYFVKVKTPSGFVAKEVGSITICVKDFRGNVIFTGTPAQLLEFEEE